MKTNIALLLTLLIILLIYIMPNQELDSVVKILGLILLILRQVRDN